MSLPHIHLTSFTWWILPGLPPFSPLFCFRVQCIIVNPNRRTNVNVLLLIQCCNVLLSIQTEEQCKILDIWDVRLICSPAFKSLQTLDFTCMYVHSHVPQTSVVRLKQALVSIVGGCETWARRRGSRDWTKSRTSSRSFRWRIPVHVGVQFHNFKHPCHCISQLRVVHNTCNLTPSLIFIPFIPGLMLRSNLSSTYSYIYHWVALFVIVKFHGISITGCVIYRHDQLEIRPVGRVFWRGVLKFLLIIYSWRVCQWYIIITALS